VSAEDAFVEVVGEPSARHHSLADAAYRHLRGEILNSRLAPGTPLSVPALARRMSISRSPVREAVQRLIHEGLASHIPNAGAEVTRLAIAELVEIYVVKEPLAGLASRLAAPRLTEADVVVLEQMMQRQEDALRVPTTEDRFMAMDLEFHGFISAAAGNATLAAAIDQFTSKTTLAFPSAWSNPTYARLSIEEHRAITDALVGGDPEEAERCTCLHVRRVRVRLARWHQSIGDEPAATVPPAPSTPARQPRLRAAR
jgi:DNA-binding GntR family transcriptional regulator